MVPLLLEAAQQVNEDINYATETSEKQNRKYKDEIVLRSYTSHDSISVFSSQLYMKCYKTVPTCERVPTPHFWLNFLYMVKVYSNECNQSHWAPKSKC